MTDDVVIGDGSYGEVDIFPFLFCLIECRLSMANCSGGGKPFDNIMEHFRHLASWEGRERRK